MHIEPAPNASVGRSSPPPVIGDIRLINVDGLLTGGFSPVLNAAESKPVTEATTNNCHGGNCHSGCGGGKEM